MSTKALAVKSAIKALIEANVPAGTQVTYGVPVRSADRQWVCVNDIHWNGDEWATNRSRNEHFSVTVIFNVQILAGDALAVETAVLALAATFEAALSVDPSLGGLCITSILNPHSLRAWPATEFYEAQFDTAVTVTCRP